MNTRQIKESLFRAFCHSRDEAVKLHVVFVPLQTVKNRVAILRLDLFHPINKLLLSHSRIGNVVCSALLQRSKHDFEMGAVNLAAVEKQGVFSSRRLPIKVDTS